MEKAKALRSRRRQRIRSRIRLRGQNRPRLSVFRSLTNISVQVIDDLEGKTLASASSLEKDVRGAIDGMNKTDVAKKVGTLLGERAKKAGVSVIADGGVSTCWTADFTTPKKNDAAQFKANAP